MLNRSRVGRHLDTARLGQALARPGMDTRTWVSIAIATTESFVDKEHGVFVGVALLPSGEKYTARVSADYAGKGFGVYSKIHKDDDLAVIIPSGNPASGCIVTARLWTRADPPPTEAKDDDSEYIIVVEKDKNLRLKVTGSGKIELASDDTVTLKSPKVRLGEEEATEQVILGTTFRTNQKVMDNSLFSYLTAAGAALTSAGGDPVLLALASTAAAGLTTAGAQITLAASAVNTFESGAGANDYLSQVTNTK